MTFSSLELCSLRTTDQKLEKLFSLCLRTLSASEREGLFDGTGKKWQDMYSLVIGGYAHMLYTADTRRRIRTLSAISAVFPDADPALILFYPEMLNTYYLYTERAGDISTLIQPAADALLKMQEKYGDGDGLLERCAVSELPFCYGEENAILNAAFVGAILTLYRLSRITQTEVSLPFSRRSLLDAFHARYFDQKKRLYHLSSLSSETPAEAQTLPLYYGFPHEDGQTEMADCIARSPLSDSVGFTYFMVRALGQVEQYDDELSLLLTSDPSSYLGMLYAHCETAGDAWRVSQIRHPVYPGAVGPLIILLLDTFGVDASALFKGISSSTPNVPPILQYELTLPFERGITTFSSDEIDRLV